MGDRTGTQARRGRKELVAVVDRNLREDGSSWYARFEFGSGVGVLLGGLCGRCCWSECEQARLGLSQDVAGDEAFELGAQG